MSVLVTVAIITGIAAIILLLSLCEGLFSSLFMVRHPLAIFIGLLLSLFLSVTGIITGHIAQYFVWYQPENQVQKKRTETGLVLNYVALALFLLFAGAIQLAIMRNAVACQANLKSLCATLYAFGAEQRDGFFQQLSPEKGRLIFRNDFEDKVLVSAEHARRMICPYDQGYPELNKNHADDWDRDISSSYCYLGYIITNDTEMRAFAEAYKKRIAEGLPFDTDLEVPPGTGTGGSDKILRIRNNLPDILKELGWKEEDLWNVPLMWDRCVLAPDQDTPVHRHPEMPTLYPRPTGIHVAYYGDNGDLLRYGEGKWPMTEETLRLLWELEQLREESNSSDTIASDEDAD